MNIIEFRHELLERDPETRADADTFLRAVYGLEMTAEQLERFRLRTGRSEPRPGGYPESALLTGRQGGKTELGGDVLSFEAVMAERKQWLGAYTLGVAQDHRGALRALFRVVQRNFDASPVLRQEVVSQTADSISLANGVTIACYPCRPAAIRGIRARVAVVDELAFFRTSEGNPVDVEMLRAVRPSLLTTRGRLIVLSSPYGHTGALWELHRRHYGRDDSATLVWVASSAQMNPSLPADYLERMREDDPEAYRSEVLGEFRAGLATLFDPEALDACVADWRELQPVGSALYSGFYDASGGRRDAATAGVAHKDGTRVVVDLVRAWPAPHNPASVIAEAAALFKSYRVHEIEADRYGGAFPAEAFRAHGITCKTAELDRSALYLELLPLVNAGSVDVPNDPALLRELRGLERRRGPSGRDRVDHRPGSHDDRANSLAGVVNILARRTAPTLTERDIW